MDPQQGTLGVPLSKDVSLEEPSGSSSFMNFARSVVIRPRIR